MSNIEKKHHSISTNVTKLSDDAKAFILASQAANTRRAYQADLKQFNQYLSDLGLSGHQVDGYVIANYLSDLAKNRGKKVSTIQRRLIAIRALFNQYGNRLIEQAKQQGESIEYHNPADSLHVKNTMKGISRTFGVAPKQKKAATKEIVDSMIREMGDDLPDLRNKAILSLGFSGAFRRSELSALNVEDIQDDADGIKIHIRRSKTDQTGEGEIIFIYYSEKASTCPVRLLKRWLREANIKDGAVFRRFFKGGKMGNRITDRTVAEVMKDASEKAGFDKADFSGHSLRRGFITTNADRGLEERDIMRHTRHKSVVVFRRYVESVNVKKNNPTKGL
jgi:site-specific recombinase XerD